MAAVESDHRGAPGKRLVLHFDINETIMVGDPVANVPFDESLNNVLAKAAGVRFDSSSGEYQWHDGSPLNPADRDPDAEPPPLLLEFRLPPGCTRYFEAFRRHEAWPASRFTEPGMPGEVYRPIFERMLEALAWPHEPHPELAKAGRHFLIPAFFHTLHTLLGEGREFAVVLRTFGTDLPDVAAGLGAYARGEHPDFPASTAESGGATLKAMRTLELADADARWALRREDRQQLQSPIHMHCYDCVVQQEGYGKDLAAVEDPNGEPVKSLLAEDDIVDLITGSAALGVRDDYHFWRGHNYLPGAGKPVWITADDDSVHHIFFDDNIHDKSHDSIVAVRARPSRETSFFSVSGEITRNLEGVVLVKAQLVEAVCDTDYFLKHIARCEANFAAAAASDGGVPALFLGSLDEEDALPANAGLT